MFMFFIKKPHLAVTQYRWVLRSWQMCLHWKMLFNVSSKVKYLLFLDCHLWTLSTVAMRQVSDKEITTMSSLTKVNISLQSAADLAGRIVMWIMVQQVICSFLQLSETFLFFWWLDSGQHLNTAQFISCSPYPEGMENEKEEQKQKDFWFEIVSWVALLWS